MIARINRSLERRFGTARYWTLRRQLFFVQQRCFALLSILLLDNAVSSRLRMTLLCAFGGSAGEDSIVRGDLVVLESFNFAIGSHIYIGSQCTLDGSSRITIGDNVVIAYNVVIVTGTHHIGPQHRRAGTTNPQPVTIDDGCWIGARATLLPGVTIGRGVVIAAESVVTKDVAPNTIVAGNPARVIRALTIE